MILSDDIVTNGKFCIQKILNFSASSIHVFFLLRVQIKNVRSIKTASFNKENKLIEWLWYAAN